MQRRCVVVVVLAGAAAVGCSPAPAATTAATTAAGPQRVQVVTPLPADAGPGIGYRIYAARPDLTVNGRPATDTFGVTDVVALPDGTVFALQDSRISVADSDDHIEGIDWGRALVRINPEGLASLVESPYADRERGRDVAPACASPAGDLYAYDGEAGRLVARDPSGGWRAVTAPADPTTETVSTGDGGPADRATVVGFHGCAVTTDGSVFVADSCLLRRIDPAGMIETVAGRPDVDEGTSSGCGNVARSLAGEPRSEAPPSYDGPGHEAELGWLSAVAAGSEDSVWLSAMWGVQQLTPDGRLRSVSVPDPLLGVSRITSLATLPDGTLLAAYGTFGPTGVAGRDPATGDWAILLPVDEDEPFTGVAAPAPLGDLDLYRADLAASRDRIYLGVASGLNAGVIAVPVE